MPNFPVRVLLNPSNVLNDSSDNSTQGSFLKNEPVLTKQSAIVFADLHQTVSRPKNQVATHCNPIMTVGFGGESQIEGIFFLVVLPTTPTTSNYYY